MRGGAMNKEPVALLEVTPGENGKECRYKTLAEDLPIGTYELYLSTPKPTQDEEPVAWMLNGEIYNVKQRSLFSDNPGEELPGQIPLYSHPAPRPEFVRLSEEEIMEIVRSDDEFDEMMWDCTSIRFARAIEDALEEKNK